MMMMTDEDMLKELEEMTMNAEKLQQQTLSTILRHNRGVTYLQRYLQGFNSDEPISAATFRRLVPLSSYDDYIEYIKTIADGVLEDRDPPLLSVDPLLLFFYSSGSSSSSMKPKLIPYFDSTPGKAVASFVHRVSAAILRRLFPPRPTVKKVLWFIYGGNVTETKGGYKTMGATSYGFQSDTKSSSPLLSMIVSPKEVVLGNNIHQQMYCHLLCGLKNYDYVDGIRAPYAAGLISAFNLLELKWEQLCEDLENGFPSSEITDLAMRESVCQILAGPQPDLSNRVRLVCKENIWAGVLSKLWTNARYVKTVSSGSMRQYFSKLRYYAGEIPILGSDYFASECSVALNLDILQPPELSRYVILPTAAYFEFIPFDSKDSCMTPEDIVDLSGVEVGKMYEVVVTTYRGFYRYRMGDIVKVVGFHNSSPEIEFVMRAPKPSQDIITERDLLSAMEQFQLSRDNILASEIIDFASFLDMEMKPKQLKVFIEVKEESKILQNEKLLKSLEDDPHTYCSIIEQGLGSIYEVMKARDEVRPLLLVIVRPGSFNRLLQVTTEQGSLASQYKPPKIIRSSKVAEFFESCAILIVRAT